ncbi:MAG: ATPase, T2SS/T4P/T4SS family [Deltaproteobacteria bacterium]|nr:ATPase, T2SS/T4P/T4SS family [Deltaproteobacteria bacterium]
MELPSGVLLVTGPTGSGKTSTVYSCINQINSPQISIITAEEPVEALIDGIAQCAINPKINLTFEETLRHVVRQDPDVIVIGEIRDTFSAKIAVQAALTGHKVLTTFHTEDSVGGLLRLLNMGLEAFMISSTVVCVLAQRLLRKVCPDCRGHYAPTAVDIRRLGYQSLDLTGIHFHTGKGCPHCRHTGYKGRTGVHELLIPDEAVRSAILEQRTSQEIRHLSIESAGLVTLFEGAELVKAAAGIVYLKKPSVLRDFGKLPQADERPSAQVRTLIMSSEPSFLEIVQQHLESNDTCLPPFNTTARRIQQEIMKEDPDIQLIEQLIVRDQAITGQVLRVANSSFYKGLVKATTVRNAVLRYQR